MTGYPAIDVAILAEVMNRKKCRLRIVAGKPQNRSGTEPLNALLQHFIMESRLFWNLRKFLSVSILE